MYIQLYSMSIQIRCLIISKLMTQPAPMTQPGAPWVSARGGSGAPCQLQLSVAHPSLLPAAQQLSPLGFPGIQRKAWLSVAGGKLMAW